MNLKSQAISGVKWTSISTISIAVTQVIKISVLARFLEKSDFGLMALVVFVLGFMNLFMDMGLTTAILHKQNISKNEYASLYWLNFGFSLVLYLIIITITPAVSNFYAEKELLILLPLMGLSLIISAFGRQFKTIEQKELHFRFISLTEIIAALLSLGLAIFLAIKGYGVYALVYSALLHYILSNAIFAVNGIVTVGLKIHFTFNETKPFLKIGIFQVGSQVTNYLNRDIDILIVGKLLGAEILGGYSLAKQLIRRPVYIIDPIITKVAVSIFPRFQNDDSKLRLLFVKVLKNLAIVNALIYGSISILAPVVVKILYGDGYSDIVILVQLFAIVVYLRSLGGQTGILVITKGRTDLGFIWNIILLILFPAAIYFGALKSASYIILYLFILQLMLLIPAWWMFYKKLIHLPFFNYLLPILIPLVYSTAIFYIFSLFANNLSNQIIFTVILFFISVIYAYFNSDEFRLFIQNKIKK